MEIKAYNQSSPVYNNNLNVQREDGTLNMQDFLNLLVAQMTNQDAMNPMDNTEFISQMAQFSSLQAMSDLTKISVQGQVTSLVGKNVVVADYDNKGQLIVDEGIVQRVTIFGSEAKLFVNDKEYKYSNVMEIKAIEKEETVEEDPVLKTLKEILTGINKLNTEVPDEIEVEEDLE